MIKKQKQATKGVNILNDESERKKFKTALATVTHYFQQVDDVKEGIKETVADLATQYGLDKKTIRKLALTMYRHNYSSLIEENLHFSELYETIIEGKLRDDADTFEDLNDPLEKEQEAA